MKKPLQKMPVSKYLSYAFAAVAKRDVLCSKMTVTTAQIPVRSETGRSVLWYQTALYFEWAEARPASGKPGMYSVDAYSYRSPDLAWYISGPKRFKKIGDCKALLTREEAVAALKDFEQKQAEKKNTYRLREDRIPRPLRQFTV